MRHKVDKELGALVDELAGLQVFADLDRAVVEALATTGRVVHLPAQWALLTEQQPADCCYVLLAGETEVRQQGEPVAQLHPGALVGEAALVEHKTRNATVVTVTEVRALRLGFAELAELFAAHRSVQRAFEHAWEQRAADD